MEWRDIETAPKDGRWVVLATDLPILCESPFAVAYWDNRFWRGPPDNNGVDRRIDFFPTHWMPLPEPPIGEQ